MAKKQEENVKVELEEPKLEEASPGLEVNLEKPDETEKKEAKDVQAGPESSGVSPEALRQIQNQLAAGKRVTENLRREVEQLRTGASGGVSGAAQIQEPTLYEEANRLVQEGRWHEAVEKLATKKAEELLTNFLIAQQQQTETSEQDQIRRTSVSKVVSRYPELDPTSGDESSEVSRAYNQVLNANPRLLRDPYGPELAMYLMEETFEKQTPEEKPTELAQNQEVVRRAQAAQAAMPSGRQGSKTNTYVLTKDQRDMCDRYGWKYEDYAKIAKSLETQKEVTP